MTYNRSKSLYTVLIGGRADDINPCLSVTSVMGPKWLGKKTF